MDFSRMTRSNLEKYVDFLLWHYRVVDALWFLAVEDKFGLDEAVRMNEDIWARIGAMAAKDIKKTFHIEGRGVAAIIEAYSYFPWSNILSYEVVEQTEDRALIRVTRCPPQEARLKHGKGEFPCKAMHYAELSNFAKNIDDRVKVTCKYAPPDKHPADRWCEWELKT